MSFGSCPCPRPRPRPCPRPCPRPTVSAFSTCPYSQGGDYSTCRYPNLLPVILLTIQYIIWASNIPTDYFCLSQAFVLPVIVLKTAITYFGWGKWKRWIRPSSYTDTDADPESNVDTNGNGCPQLWDWTPVLNQIPFLALCSVGQKLRVE